MSENFSFIDKSLQVFSSYLGFYYLFHSVQSIPFLLFSFPFLLFSFPFFYPYFNRPHTLSIIALKRKKKLGGRIFFWGNFFFRVITSPKIVINFPGTNEKLICKVEPYWLSGYQDLSVQTDRKRSCYFIIRVMLMQSFYQFYFFQIKKRTFSFVSYFYFYAGI